MTLQQAREKLAAATTDSERRDMAKVVAIKEARVSRDGGTGEGERVKGEGVPVGENPYDNAFRGMRDSE